MAETPTDRQQPHDPPPTPTDEHDESLVRWYLSLTPRQRLDVLNANINAIERARDAQSVG